MTLVLPRHPGNHSGFLARAVRKSWEVLAPVGSKQAHGAFHLWAQALLQSGVLEPQRTDRRGPLQDLEILRLRSTQA